MTIRARWQRMHFFWKTFLFLATLMAVVAGLVEGVLEPLAEDMLRSFSGGFAPWHEVFLWAGGVVIPSLVCGVVFSGILSRRISAMLSVAARLSRGYFTARLEARAESRDVFDLLAGGFNDLASSMEALIENERRLLTDVLHELRSPLSRMGVALELLPLKQDCAVRDQLLARLKKEIRHMSELVEQLLAHGKERLLSLREKEEAVNVSELLEEVIADLAFHGRHEGKTIVGVVPPGAVVMGQAALLRTMLMNVGVNALFYSPSDKPVRVGLARRDGDIWIHVRDFGPGVPEADLENIFKAFYRVGGSRAGTAGGVGLGLALAREAAALCGGVIEARNADPGLEVTARFPAHSGALPQEEGAGKAKSVGV